MGRSGGKKGKGKLKTSASKLSNKRINKLAKQGKLKRDKSKQIKEKKELEGRRGNEKQFRPKKDLAQEDEIEVEEEDIQFFKSHQQRSSFVSNVDNRLLEQPSDGHKKGKKRKVLDDVEGEAEYERLPRKQVATDNNRKMMLPIKTKHGVVQRVLEDEDEPVANGDGGSDEASGSEMADAAEEREEPLPILSGVELYAQRQRKLQECKQRIALLSSAIIENPNESTKKLRELVGMLKETDPDVFVTVRKFTMMSLLEVFNDIIPGYYVRLPTEKEQTQKMKKETKEILGHEVALVRFYRDYLEFLDRTAKGNKKEASGKKKIKKNKHGSDEAPIPAATQQKLKQLSVQCLCSLLQKHPHFNYTNNIIAVIVPFMNSNNEQISDTACNCVRQLFKTDKSGHVILEITKCVGRMIKARDYRIQPKVLNTFLSLRIKEVSYTDPVTKEEEKKKQNSEKLSRRERKLKKKEMFIARDLEETRATEDKRKRLKLHTETIQTVFLTYFRILKKATHSVLFPSVLEGLAKFAHMINVDFFEDLFAVFNKLIATEELSYRESLHCVQTAFTILSGQGSALNIDPVVFYKHLYKTLYHVHAGCSSDDVKIVLDCLDIMISRRKRQVSQQRILAFLKRLMTLSLQQTTHGTLGLLSVIRSFIITYSYCDVLMDNEAQGSGVYMPELDDPEHCNAHNAMLWELALLRHHYDPSVRRFCTHLRNGAPTSGEGQLPVELRKLPTQILNEYQRLDIFNQFVPEKPKGPHKHKGRQGDYLQQDVAEQVLKVLSATEDFVDVT